MKLNDKGIVTILIKNKFKSKMKLKVCGLKYKNNIAELVQLPIDYIGFIFYKKSQRYIGNNIDLDFVSTLPKHIKKVGVFVNESIYSILSLIAKYNLDIVQLHGDESPEICTKLNTKVNVIKSFQLHANFDFKQLESYAAVVDYFLFDNKTKHYGGSGKVFNWQLLNKYNYKIPFFLSGGISQEHIKDLKQLNISQLVALDINSKFETEPGLKDHEKIKQFIINLNANDNK